VNARNTFVAAHAQVMESLKRLHEEIDALGLLGMDVVHHDEPDMLGCFASNTLYGAEALLREMKAVVLKSGRRRRTGKRKAEPTREGRET
jgi:hypothetical protein